jgi:anti-sigma B factor antagonist
MGESQRQAREPPPPTVIRLPAEIDATNAGRIGEELDSAFASGVATVIADMTATTFCDSTGARELLLAHRKATADGIELRIVIPPSANIRRLSQLTGLDQMLAIYPNLAAVSADGHMGQQDARQNPQAKIRPVNASLPPGPQRYVAATQR